MWTITDVSSSDVLDGGVSDTPEQYHHLELLPNWRKFHCLLVCVAELHNHEKEIRRIDAVDSLASPK